MKVELYLPPSLQHLAGNIKSIAVDGSTVKECLQAMVGRYPELKEKILTRNNRLRKGLSIYKNREKADITDLAAPLRDGDKLYILNVIFGG